MPFEIVEPGSFLQIAPLGEGECTLGKHGTLLARTSDLELVGIGKYAILLADKGSFRIGLRAVRDGEQQRSMACAVVTTGKGPRRRDAGRRRVNVSRAIIACGLEPEAVAGRYTLQVFRDELLFVTLTEAKPVERPATPRRK
jgi:hypothetical protein